MISRRSFLAMSLALAACSSTGQLGALLRPQGRRRPRYFISTPSTYWKKQDLSLLKPVTKSVRLPGVAEPDLHGDQPFTILTAVNDDGSDLRRVLIPLAYHCVARGADSSLVYLMGNHRPSALLALDVENLEIANLVLAPQGGDERTFGGHGVAVGGHFAYSMNGNKKGFYDSISIRDPSTLREVQSYPTYGFQAHEIRLSPDKKYFVCGHYGSYLGQGPYKGMGIYGGDGSYGMNRSPEFVYPSSVTMVEVSSGKRFRALSDVKSGQEGHADSDEHYNAYLPNVPAKIHSRKNVEKHPRFQEGEYTKPDRKEFAVTDNSLGISLAYDRKFGEVIVPDRGSPRLLITDSKLFRQRELDFGEQTKALPWLKVEGDFVSGLDFHPDGKHYILSTSAGFAAFERGTHRLNPAMSFPLPLLVHSHLCIV